MALTTVSSDRLSTNVKNTNFTAAEKQDLTDDILPLAGQLGNRRLNINGDMQVAQRGTSSDISSTAYGSLDRFQLEVGGLDNAVTMAQVDVASGTTPYTLGFRKALKLTNGDQSSGAGGTDTMRILHKFEAQDIAQSGWNYKSASSFITLSFWIKSSVAQSFKVAVISWDGTIMTFTFDTGSLTADTWTKVTKTIPGNSNITIDNDNNLGFQISFFQYLGTTYTASGYTEDAWAAFANPQTKDQTTTWYTTNDATYELTGVQLEVGSVATDFEHRSFGKELALCQRYFQRVNGSLIGVGANATSIRANYTPIVNLRASPTITGNNPVSFNDPGIASPTQSSFDCGLQFTYTPNNIGMTLGFGNFPSNGQTAQGKPYIQWDSANDYIDFAAEL